MEKPDITTQTDVVLLVDTFYGKVRKNPTLNVIFEDVAHIDWPGNLPKMYAFWSDLQLGEKNYAGNPMTAHVQLSKLTPISYVQFGAWLSIFVATVDELFSGAKASEAKIRAGNIAGLMMHKIQESK